MVILGIYRGEMIGDGVHIGPGLCQGDAGPEARDAMNTETRAADFECAVLPLANGNVDVFRPEAADG